MTKKVFLVLVILVLGATLAACGETEPEVNTQATEIAAGVAATLTAQAPLPTVVVTPPPPTETAPPPTSEPEVGPDTTNIHLEADGSGDYATLSEALQVAGEGATITLGPGTYRLGEATVVSAALNLVGAGMDETEIVSSAPDYVLRFEGDGPFSAEGITFRHEGQEQADVVAVSGGTVSFLHCRFAGGVWNEETGGGSGLFLEGSTTGKVLNCEASGNGLHGVLLMRNAHPVLENGSFRENGDSGIAYVNQAGGIARQNDCSRNASQGIYLDDQAAPTLEANSCRENGDSGIAFWGKAAGYAIENDCSGNTLHGIALSEIAQPGLEGNTCRDNGDSGIAFFDQSGGSARANVCSGNAAYGIYVAEGADPGLAENECELGGKAAEGPASPGVTTDIIGFASERDGNWEVYVMDADGSGATRLTDSPAKDWKPDGSPDGSRIVFESDRDGNSEVYVMNADGSQQTNLTNDPAYDSSPAWSPDGSHIVFQSGRDGNSEIYVMEADGSGVTNLTNNPAGDQNPSWSPEGSHIVFESDRDGNSEIYVLQVDSGEVSRLTDNPAFDFSPVWSPDGSQIAFTSNRDGSGQIYVMQADGSGVTALTNHPAGNGAPDWSPDGQRIVFASYRDGPGEIYTMNADGSNHTNLTNHPADDAGWPAWWTGFLPIAEVPPAAQGPRFNPDGDPWCFNTPDQVFAGDWQVVAPREVVVIGDSAEIGLRNQAGSGETYPLNARIIAPDESEATATASITGDEWVLLVYPTDFPVEEIDQRGAYTIIWVSDGVFIACDGFIVGGGASP